MQNISNASASQISQIFETAEAVSAQEPARCDGVSVLTAPVEESIQESTPGAQARCARIRDAGGLHMRFETVEQDAATVAIDTGSDELSAINSKEKLEIINVHTKLYHDGDSLEENMTKEMNANVKVTRAELLTSTFKEAELKSLFKESVFHDLRRLGYKNFGWANDALISRYMEMLSIYSSKHVDKPESFALFRGFNPGFFETVVTRTLQSDQINKRITNSKKLLDLEQRRWKHRYLAFSTNIHNEHWILFVVDTVAETLEYYDSGGIRPKKC